MTTYQRLMAEAQAEFDAWEQEQRDLKISRLLKVAEKFGKSTSSIPLTEVH